MLRRISILPALAALAIALAIPAPAGAAMRNGPIVFAGGTAAQGNGLWAWKANWRGLRRITTDPTDLQPKGSRDGRWVVFIRQVTTPLPGGGGTFPAYDVFRARSDGSQVLQVTSGANFDRAPSFTRSGQRILFSRTIPQTGLPEDQTAGEHIFSVRLDGTGLQQLTTGNFSDRSPVMSPNGRIIAFDRFQEGHTRHVFTMRIDGSNVRDATPRLAAWSSQPTFNPSGNRIAYVRSFPGNATSDIFTIRPNGSDVRRITGRPGRPLGGVSSPSWSPDGTRIVFQHSPESAAQFSKLQIVRVSNRRLGARIGGRRFARSPDMRTPTWLSR
jgi:Tol biopolymer transport system component